MVSIASRSMYVRHLNHSQKRQQDEAHHSRYPQSTQLGVTSCSETCPKSCQWSILRKIVHGIGAYRKSRIVRLLPTPLQGRKICESHLDASRVDLVDRLGNFSWTSQSKHNVRDGCLAIAPCISGGTAHFAGGVGIST